MDNNVNLKLKNDLIITQEMIYAISLLKFDNNALLDELKRITEDNVCVELIDKRQTYVENFNELNIPIANVEDFRYKILKEFRLLSTSYEDVQIAEYIIFNLDDKGFYKDDLKEVSMIYKTNIKHIQFVIDNIKNINMYGLASKSIKEFLIFQTDDQELKYFLEKYYGELSSIDRIFETSDYSLEKIKGFISKIKSLRLYPLQGLVNPVNPIDINDSKIDLFVEINNDINVHINSLFQFNINTDYINIIPDVDYDTKKYILNDYYQAKFIKKAIEERNKNLINITKEIVSYQINFFTSNDNLITLNMKKIADLTGLSISTVSRAVSYKNISYNGKIFELKNLFVSGITEGEDTFSSDQIKKALLEIIEFENYNKVYSDNEICKSLNKSGIPVKRRTIAKYREELNIPNSRARKRIHLIKEL